MNWYCEAKRGRSLPAMKIPAVRQLLSRLSCQFLRQGAGSHEIWSCPPSGSHITLPVHPSVEFRPQQLIKLLKQIGISPEQAMAIM
jgi:predicted RNA binding protein YcfA (HicA-like mRNA interferase family)